MHLLSKALGYIMAFVAGMAVVVLMQVEGIFPAPYTVNADGSWNIHPLYAFPVWVYVGVALFFAALSLMFSLMGREVAKF